MTIKIVIADDHKIVREGLRSLLDTLSDVKVVGEARNGREAIRLARDLSPDILILDVAMPELNGVEATRKVRAQAPNARVIGLSMHSDRHFIAGMLQAGAAGYLQKESAFEELATAIRTVMAGQVYLGSGIAGVVVEDYKSLINETGERETLTAREREVLQLLAEGKKTADIAEALHVSVKTVETHRRQIMQKLDIHSIANLTKYAIRTGLTSVKD